MYIYIYIYICMYIRKSPLPRGRTAERKQGMRKHNNNTDTVCGITIGCMCK